MTAGLVYLDASALVKLIVREPESEALFEWLADRPERVTSIVARTEVGRALRRARVPAATVRRASAVLDRLALIGIDRAVADAAALLDPPALRPLDAIHLATALSVGGELAGMVTYDGRLAAAAAESRLEVWAPGQ